MPQGVIASPHSRATHAGVAAFADGGTAVDAAIAAAAVLTAVYPQQVALGGDLVALVLTPDGVVSCVNASGWSAAATDAGRLREVHGQAMPTRGAETVTVPGGVRGWEALRDFGSRLTWDRLLADAQSAAVDAEVSPSLARHLRDADNADLMGSDAWAQFNPAGDPPDVGATLTQPALAALFGDLRRDGPTAFYEGKPARSMLAYLRSRGSVLTAADLADFRAEICVPLRAVFDGLTVHTSPPNTSGFAVLRALRAAQALGDPLGADLADLVASFVSANAVRNSRLADPRRTPVDVTALLDEHPPVCVSARRAARGDTVGIATADDDGNAVSLLMSVYESFGSGLLDPGTGVLFQNRGTGFSLRPDSPNVIAPRKRTAHTLTPVITTRVGLPRQVLATMGGQGQPQILTQLLLRLSAGATPQQAVSAARVIAGVQAVGDSASSVTVEAGLTESASESLRRAGITARVLPTLDERLGHANIVQIEPDGGYAAAADPRSDGAALLSHRAIPGTSPLDT